MPALRPRERRLLILAGLIAIGVAGYLYVVEPLIEAHAATRELATLRDFEAQGLHPLPVLRELTDTIPGDAWLTNLSVDRNGLELGGFANAASQLIPLLEASPTLERVEFTSPVTKGRDREQFRLRATWERRGGAR